MAPMAVRSFEATTAVGFAPELRIRTWLHGRHRRDGWPLESARIAFEAMPLKALKKCLETGRAENRSSGPLMKAILL